MDVVRVATAGSVDDGKSTLIGRLLYEAKAVYADQLEAVRRVSAARGDDDADLALLTDGLRAEREQGITIDVAHRYFATARRAFIVADTPGHVQYTRNMVTGASTADVAVVLVDARHGLVEQSRRHAFLASLLRVPHLVVAVNKMDLVGYDEGAFEAVRAAFEAFSAKLDVVDVTVIPLSALHGENVTSRSSAMPWYEGPSLLHHLETVHVASDRNLVDVRFPVQCVIRPGAGDRPDYRGYAGQVASGVLRPGDEVVVLPGGFGTTIAGIDTADGPVAEAFAPMSVTIRLADDLDVSRGDMICRPQNRPEPTQDLDAMVTWLSDEPMRVGQKFAIKHTTRWARALVSGVRYRLDVNTLHRDEAAEGLSMNEIGRLRLRTTTPILGDPYRRNRATGCFVLVDETTHRTVGAGTIS